VEGKRPKTQQKCSIAPFQGTDNLIDKSSLP
jgi:hypothetical protein